VYSTNLVDLLEVRQKTGPGTSERMAAFTWNNQHLPLTYADASGQTNRFTYNPRGQLLTFTDPLGQTTTLSYDTNGFLLTIDTALPGTNDATTFTYDRFGRIRTISPPDGETFKFDYDALDRLTVITFPDGSYEEFGYDRLDRSFARDRLGRRSEYTWNNLRQLVQLQDPLGRVTRFGWCECGVLTSLTDPMGRMTTWQYDAQNRVSSKHLPDGTSLTYIYDPASSRLKSLTDEKGQTKVYSYYPDNNLRSISYANSQVPTPTVTCQYDPSYNRMTVLSDGLGTTTWNYYPVGVLGALKVASVSASWHPAVVTYQYDALGRGTNRIIGAVEQTYAFDVIGRITNVVNALGSFVYAYDGASARVADVVYPTGQKSHFDYFSSFGDRRLQRITHTGPDASLISQFDYGYDPVGNITHWSQELGVLTNAWSIHYDDADQVSRVEVDSAGATVTYSYNYDPAANRVSEDVDGARRSFNYNALNQLTSSSDSATNLATYEWDAEARLSAVTHGINRSEFTYDGFGRRIRIVEKQNEIQVSAVSLLWCDAELCELRDDSGASVLRRIFPQGESLTSGITTKYYFTKDHLGSIREALDPTGSVVSRYTYRPFGSQTPILDGFKPASGFAGYFEHRPSGLNLAVYRALNTDIGRWLSRDPLQEKAGFNLYSYVKNKPLLVTDPLGLDGPECTSFNVDAAIQHLNANADLEYQGRNLCARYTMNAVDAGCGTTTKGNRPTHGSEFGDLLSSLGFVQVATSDYQAGDVVVFESGTGAYASGHMQMFDGNKWVSDFVQSGLYPGPGEWKNLSRKTYRHISVPTKPKANSCTTQPDRPWLDFGPFADFL
jgi:RHS repeat-associated protein